MKRSNILFFMIFLCACAKVSVEATKPIKVDISMRVDVYQHVEKDVNSIVDQIYGKEEKKLNAVFGIGEVYAADFSQEVLSAIDRSKSRLARLEEYFSKGYIGENREGLLVILLNPDSYEANLKVFVDDENKDRTTLYNATAKKNDAVISVVRKAFFDKHYEKAPAGSSFEVCDSSGCSWRKK